MGGKEPITYTSTGVDYKAMNPFKRYAQQRGQETDKNLLRLGMRVVGASRGESAFVWEDGDRYLALTIEGLGTKNLVAEKMRVARAMQGTNDRTFFDNIAQCTAAMVLNDNITVGADPMVINQYLATGSGKWFKDEQATKDFTDGWIRACNLAGVVSGGGESATLIDIIYPETADFAGAAVGIVRPKERLMVGGQKLVPGDSILLVESSGIHANGLTLGRTVATMLPDGYFTLLSNGQGYGEVLLTPTHIYVSLLRAYFEAGLDLHSAVNITGHGWKKLMRANRGDLSYIIDTTPEPQPVFDFIQKHSRNTDRQMYGTFNMGAGFAVFMPAADVEKAQRITKDRFGWQSLNAGYVEEGSRQVVIRPKQITYQAETLQIR